MVTGLQKDYLVGCNVLVLSDVLTSCSSTLFSFSLFLSLSFSPILCFRCFH